MRNEKLFTEEELKVLRKKNYDIVTDLGTKVNFLKGYEAAYSSPGDGKMIINLNDVNYLIDIEPVGEGSLLEFMKSHQYLLK